MSFTYENDIHLLAEDIERWAGTDARIIGAVKQLLKLHQAEVDALAFEARALDKMVAANVCQLCLQPSDAATCSRCETQGGLYGDWRSDCGEGS